MVTKQCLTCKSKFKTFKCLDRTKKFCSMNCYNLDKKGRHAPNKGKKGLSGSEHPMWKGDMVGYQGVHRWIKINLGKPTKCEHCGKDGLTGHKIGWANIDHRYRRILNDYLRLCVSCHMKYDYVYNKRQTRWGIGKVNFE